MRYEMLYEFLKRVENCGDSTNEREPLGLDELSKLKEEHTGLSA